MLTKVSIEEFTNVLRSLSERGFPHDEVGSYIRGVNVDQVSLRRFLFFGKRTYTRNLIFRDLNFELIAIGWEVNQSSSIHDHAGQSCWMTVPVGKLRVQNYRILEQDSQTGFCRLEATDQIDLERHSKTEVDPSEPIHEVGNPGVFGKRAVSLHVYSRPIDQCLVFTPSINWCSEVVPRYTSQYGHLSPGVELA